MPEPPQQMILIDGKPRTLSIESCRHNARRGLYDITFRNRGKTYSYGEERVEVLSHPTSIDPAACRLLQEGRVLGGISLILQYHSSHREYYRIQQGAGWLAEYPGSDIEVVRSCADSARAKSVLGYMKEVASSGGLRGDDGGLLLAKQYERLTFIADHLAAAPYLSPQRYPIRKLRHGSPIIPFGCNNSQLAALRNALQNQVSVIQGPPGTGKTQTILNLIANILLEGKTVLVVSNNNSATDNVLEKLTAHGLGFIAAPLGNSDNKRRFVEAMSKGRTYPDDFGTWQAADINASEIQSLLSRLQELYSAEEELARLKAELADTELQQRHFLADHPVAIAPADHLLRQPSRRILALLVWQQEALSSSRLSAWRRMTGWLKRLAYRHVHRIPRELLHDISAGTVLRTQALFYQCRIRELKTGIGTLERKLRAADADSLQRQAASLSMQLLKAALHRTFSPARGGEPARVETLWHSPQAFLKQFPVVLSTTFSARSSLHDAEYDYVIMDEASQVPVETGLLALTCARNAVIVGDTLQLPNVVTDADRARLGGIFRQYGIADGYDSGSHSFLSSVLAVLPQVPQTLLREHYRCDPRIIGFCNRRFYGSRLAVMTRESPTPAMRVVRTVEGNHQRGHHNQREVDVIRKEVLPSLPFPPEEVGIIAPYNEQVDILRNNIAGTYDIATVHKFQGREKEAIVMSATDDLISPFADDPNLLNVAVSRAKRLFCLVVSGNPQPRQGHILDLADYIAYHGVEEQSRLHSVYDLLYKQYFLARLDYLHGHGRVSEYDSENLTHKLVTDLLRQPPFRHLDVVCHYPLRLLLADTACLPAEERRYATHPNTHIDLLIYSLTSRWPVMAVEVDGWAYHRQGTRQAERDAMKNSILARYGIPLLRLSTTGSDERATLQAELERHLAM